MQDLGSPRRRPYYPRVDYKNEDVAAAVCLLYSLSLILFKPNQRNISCTRNIKIAIVPDSTMTPMSYGSLVNGSSKPLRPGRSMADWGSPLPTRKLSPYEDVQFDTAFQPRAHRMVGTFTKHSPSGLFDLTIYQKHHLTRKYFFSMSEC